MDCIEVEAERLMLQHTIDMWKEELDRLQTAVSKLEQENEQLRIQLDAAEGRGQ